MKTKGKTKICERKSIRTNLFVYDFRVYVHCTWSIQFNIVIEQKKCRVWECEWAELVIWRKSTTNMPLNSLSAKRANKNKLCCWLCCFSMLQLYNTDGYFFFVRQFVRNGIERRIQISQWNSSLLRSPAEVHIEGRRRRIGSLWKRRSHIFTRCSITISLSAPLSS